VRTFDHEARDHFVEGHRLTLEGKGRA
jgi:hypothetical protein